MSEPESLKPCPFCGNVPNRAGDEYVWCGADGCRIRMCMFLGPSEWNTRTEWDETQDCMTDGCKDRAPAGRPWCERHQKEYDDEFGRECQQGRDALAVVQRWLAWMNNPEHQDEFDTIVRDAKALLEGQTT